VWVSECECGCVCVCVSSGEVGYYGSESGSIPDVTANLGNQEKFFDIL